MEQVWLSDQLSGQKLYQGWKPCKNNLNEAYALLKNWKQNKSHIIHALVMAIIGKGVIFHIKDDEEGGYNIQVYHGAGVAWKI